MRVVHIVPTAFNYFDDIRNTVFQIVDGLDAAGLNQEIFTLEYSEPEKNIQEQLKKIAPKRRYGGMHPLQNSLQDLASFDLVHFHVPFLGAGKALLAWRKEFRNTSMIVSYYRNVLLVDLLSFFISFYNNFYVKKFIEQADIATTFVQNGKLLDNYAKKIAVKNKIPFLFQPLTNFDDKVQLNLSDKDITNTVEFYLKLYSSFQ
jgi:hypothetical protein